MGPTPSRPPIEIRLESEARVNDILEGRLWAHQPLNGRRVAVSLRLRDQLGALVLEVPAARQEHAPGESSRRRRFGGVERAPPRALRGPAGASAE